MPAMADPNGTDPVALADPAALADAVAKVMMLRAVMMDRYVPGYYDAQRELTAIMDDESADLRERGLAAAALLEPSWLTLSGTFVAGRVKKRARAVLRSATAGRLAALPA